MENRGEDVKIFTNEKTEVLTISRVIFVSSCAVLVIILGMTTFFFSGSIRSGEAVLLSNNEHTPLKSNEVDKSIIKKVDYIKPIIFAEIGDGFWNIDTSTLRNISLGIYLKHQNNADTILERITQKIYYVDNTGKIIFIFPTNSNMRPLEMAIPMRHILANIKQAKGP